jgi:hypothetical protein
MARSAKYKPLGSKGRQVKAKYMELTRGIRPDRRRHDPLL